MHVIPSHLSHKFGGYKSVIGQVFRIWQLHQQNVHRAPSSNSCQDAWVIQTSLAPSSSSWDYYIQANMCYGALTVSDYKQILCMYILNSAVLLCWTDRVRRLVPYYTLRTRILQSLSEAAWAVIAYSWVWDLPQLHPALNWDVQAIQLVGWASHVVLSTQPRTVSESQALPCVSTYWSTKPSFLRSRTIEAALFLFAFFLKMYTNLFSHEHGWKLVIFEGKKMQK